MKFPLLFVMILSALTQLSYGKGRVIATPTERVSDTIIYQDDLDYKNLVKAIDRQLVYFNRVDLSGKIQLGDKLYERVRLKESVVHLKSIVQSYLFCLDLHRHFPVTYEQNKRLCMQTFSNSITNDFEVFKPENDAPVNRDDIEGDGETLYTAYYSPDFEGSRVKTAVFKNPIYAMPTDPTLRGMTRKQIDFEGKLEGKGLELFYVKESLFDIYLLHVEGGGRVKVKNNDGTYSHYYLSYAGSNKRKFRFLYHYMVDQGMIDPEDKSIATQREYIANNPDKAEEIFASCPSYIYFKVTVDEPVGVGNIPLTEMRSLATDTRIYKQIGIINYVKAKKPVFDSSGNVIQKEFSRFFISQDTGGAIRGKARADLYMGFGRSAELVANHLKYKGDQFFLIKKN
jgi:membrane-bound lytic murein transglycosylase A